MDEFKSPMKLPGGGEIQRCYYPFKLDTYGRGCTNNCHYCYARSVLSFRHMWDSDQPAIADYAKIEKIFEDVLIKHGMDFTVCYDSDDAYEEFRYLWANQNDCCNGTGHIPGFTTSWDAFRRP